MGGVGSGRPKNPPAAKKLLKELIPVKDIFDDEELELYNSLVDIYMADFNEDELTSTDIDDIMALATNKIIEMRLFKSAKDAPGKYLDMSQSIERLRKQSEKIKDNLSVRRKDRMNSGEFNKDISIVNLAVAFDQAKKAKSEAKMRELKKEQKEVLEQLKNNPGNRYDIDGNEVINDDID